MFIIVAYSSTLFKDSTGQFLIKLKAEWWWKESGKRLLCNGDEKRRCKNLRGVAKIKSETRFCYQMEIQVWWSKNGTRWKVDASKARVRTWENSWHVKNNALRAANSSESICVCSTVENRNFSQLFFPINLSLQQTMNLDFKNFLLFWIRMIFQQARSISRVWISTTWNNCFSRGDDTTFSWHWIVLEKNLKIENHLTLIIISRGCLVFKTIGKFFFEN